MTRHDDRTRLRHMRDHAQEAVDLASGKRREDLDTNRLLELALTRLVEIIGEAAARVSRETQDRYPQVPWPEIRVAQAIRSYPQPTLRAERGSDPHDTGFVILSGHSDGLRRILRSYGDHPRSGKACPQ